MKKLLVTGSSGLIGSEVCVYFHERGWQIHGVDNNQRAVFFGPQGDTRWNRERLQKSLAHFVHHELDIRERAGRATVKRIYRMDRKDGSQMVFVQVDRDLDPETDGYPYKVEMITG